MMLSLAVFCHSKICTNQLVIPRSSKASTIYRARCCSRYNLGLKIRTWIIQKSVNTPHACLTSAKKSGWQPDTCFLTCRILSTIFTEYQKSLLRPSFGWNSRNAWLNRPINTRFILQKCRSTSACVVIATKSVLSSIQEKPNCTHAIFHHQRVETLADLPGLAQTTSTSLV